MNDILLLILMMDNNFLISDEQRGHNDNIIEKITNKNWNWLVKVHWLVSFAVVVHLRYECG